ncbi:hypothetical protein MMC25_007840 [Agyrium rufum]|nr:hypothetical protein [Agyrium rufum]
MNARLDSKGQQSMSNHRETIFPCMTLVGHGPVASRSPERRVHTNPKRLINSQGNVIHDTPFTKYKPFIKRKLGGAVTVAKHGESLVLIKKLVGQEGQKMMHMIGKIKSQAFLQCDEIYCMEREYYLIFNHMDLTLTQFTYCTPRATDRQAGAIALQVLKGLLWLAQNFLQHGSINCGTLLINRAGVVKITNAETCMTTEIPCVQNVDDTRALGSVIMELVESGPPNFPNLQVPTDFSTSLVGFIAHSATNAPGSLIMHEFLKDKPTAHELIDLVEIASLTTSIPYPFLDDEH